MKNLSILIFIILFFYSNAHARPSIAKADWVRGHVTKLDLGAREAVDLKKGDLIYEDTSIVTGNKSVVRVRFANNSILTLGQNGKFIIEEMKDKKSTLINLLVGQLRAKVQKVKKKKNKNKFIMKTRTAAIGVRGTEFFTVYNPKSQITSLVTLEGEVAMKKVVKKRGLVDESHVKTITEDAASKSISKVNAFESILSQSDTVIVKKGRYAAVNSNFVKASQPVKIAPKQFLALKKDASLLSHTEDAIKVQEFTTKEIEDVTQEINEVEVIDPKKEGFFNEKTGDFAPKSGGILDPSTGIYVQPSSKAKYNDTTKAYELSESIGRVGVGGQYIPPAGLALDSSVGFVVVAAADNDDSKLAKAKLKELNQSIATSLPIKKDEEIIEKEIKKMAKQQIKKKGIVDYHQLYISIGTASYNSKLENLSFDLASNSNFSDGSQLSLNWRQFWNEKISTEIKMGKVELKSDFQYNSDAWSGSDNGNQENSQSLMFLTTELVHKTFNRFSSRFSLMLSTILSTRIIDDSMSKHTQPQKITSPRFSFGTTYHAYKGEKFTFNLTFDVVLFKGFEDEYDSAVGGMNKVEVDAGGGFNFSAEARWKIFTNKFIAIFMDHTEETHNFSQTGSNGTFMDIRNHYRIDKGGIILGFEI
jgi:hypothetical protein